MTWELGPERNFKKLPEYQSKLEARFQKRKELHGICQYHYDTLPQRVLYLVGVKLLLMRFIPFIFLFFTNTMFGQITNSVRSFTIHSVVLKEDRFFDVYVPTSPKSKLEVIYVLDGQALFSTVVSILKKSGHDQKIVVGIGNIWQRDRDYTPTKVQASPFIDSGAAKITGGGENFIEHLQKELIPYVNEHYPAGNSRVLIGHSLGGLIAINILLKHTDLFNKYAAIDPAMWWDEGKLLQQSKELLKKQYPKDSLFVAIANTKNKDKPTIEALKKDTSENTVLIRPTTILLDYLEQAGKNDLNYIWKYYKDNEHITVFEPAATDALQFLLQQ